MRNKGALRADIIKLKILYSEDIRVRQMSNAAFIEKSILAITKV